MDIESRNTEWARLNDSVTSIHLQCFYVHPRALSLQMRSTVQCDILSWWTHEGSSTTLHFLRAGRWRDHHGDGSLPSFITTSMAATFPRTRFLGLQTWTPRFVGTRICAMNPGSSTLPTPTLEGNATYYQGLATFVTVISPAFSAMASPSGLSLSVARTACHSPLLRCR